MGAPVVFSSGFKFAFVATWKVSCGELRDCFTRCTNGQLAAKCEQNAQQVVSLMNEQQSQKLLFKVEPLSPTKTTS